MLDRIRSTKKRRKAERLGLCPQCGHRKLAKKKKQCLVCIQYRRDWVAENSKKLCDYARKQARALRRKLLAILGGRCSNPKCRPLNEDGTLGCTDLRILHIDHKNGNGNKDRL